MTEPRELLPCPFCGGPVALEEATPTRDRIYGERRWWGVVCRNTTNRGGTCAIEQRPSASQEAAIERWNRRTPQPTQAQAGVPWQWVDEVRQYLTAAADSSMSRNNSEQLASELLEQVPPQAQAGVVPMYRLLQSGVDRIEAADEFLSDGTTTWAIDPNGIFVGNIYGGHVLRPARRRIKGGQHGTE